jgi:hypothetical protein
MAWVAGATVAATSAFAGGIMYCRARPNVRISRNMTESSDRWITFHNNGDTTLYIDAVSANDQDLLQFLRELEDVSESFKDRFSSTVNRYKDEMGRHNFPIGPKHAVSLLNFVTSFGDAREMMDDANTVRKHLQNANLAVHYHSTFGLYTTCQHVE